MTNHGEELDLEGPSERHEKRFYFFVLQQPQKSLGLVALFVQES